MNKPEVLALKPFEQRKVLRKAALALRDHLTDEEKERWSAEIAVRTRALIHSTGVRTVHCYLSYRSEVDTHGLIKSLLEDGIEVIVPTIRRRDGADIMVHARLSELDGLQIGAHGIEEPTGGEHIEMDRISLVLLPLVAFDRFGMRLGYGKGFYDKFLSTTLQAKRIGIAFSMQELPEIPQLAHDQLLDMVVTEIEIIECADERGAKRQPLILN